MTLTSDVNGDDNDDRTGDDNDDKDQDKGGGALVMI